MSQRFWTLPIWSCTNHPLTDHLRQHSTPQQECALSRGAWGWEGALGMSVLVVELVFLFGNHISRWWQLKHFFHFYPDPWGFHDPIWRAYFSNGLVQPPTRFLFVNNIWFLWSLKWLWFVMCNVAKSCWIYKLELEQLWRIDVLELVKTTTFSNQLAEV